MKKTKQQGKRVSVSMLVCDGAMMTKKTKKNKKNIFFYRLKCI